MLVLRRIPNEISGADRLSPWKGCLHIDQEGRAWYATDLAKPTQFTSVSEADDCAHDIMVQFPEQEIQVAVYEEVFPPKPTAPFTTVATVILNREGLLKAEIPSDWDWNNIPF